MERRIQHFLSIAALATATLFANPARAELVTFRFDGVITRVTSNAGPLQFSLGDAYSLVYTLETTAAGYRPGNVPPGILEYNAIRQVSLHIDGNPILFSDISYGPVTVSNDACPSPWECTDGYNFMASNSIISPFFFRLGASMSTSTPTASSVLTSTALPITAPNVHSFGSSAVEFYFLDTNTNLNTAVFGTITSISPVPLPAAAWLLGSGLLALGLRRRQTRAA